MSEQQTQFGHWYEGDDFSHAPNPLQVSKHAARHARGNRGRHVRPGRLKTEGLRPHIKAIAKRGVTAAVAGVAAFGAAHQSEAVFHISNKTSESEKSIESQKNEAGKKWTDLLGKLKEKANAQTATAPVLGSYLDGTVTIKKDNETHIYTDPILLTQESGASDTDTNGDWVVVLDLTDGGKSFLPTLAKIGSGEGDSSVRFTATNPDKPIVNDVPLYFAPQNDNLPGIFADTAFDPNVPSDHAGILVSMPAAMSQPNKPVNPTIDYN